MHPRNDDQSESADSELDVAKYPKQLEDETFLEHTFDELKTNKSIKALTAAKAKLQTGLSIRTQGTVSHPELLQHKAQPSTSRLLVGPSLHTKFALLRNERESAAIKSQRKRNHVNQTVA